MKSITRKLFSVAALFCVLSALAPAEQDSLKWVSFRLPQDRFKIDTTYYDIVYADTTGKVQVDSCIVIRIGWGNDWISGFFDDPNLKTEWLTFDGRKLKPLVRWQFYLKKRHNGR